MGAMPTLPTVPETDVTSQGGWVRSKRDIPADEEAVELKRWPTQDGDDDEDEEDEPTKDTESGVRTVIPPRPT
jgi:hypothetical protein